MKSQSLNLDLSTIFDLSIDQSYSENQRRNVDSWQDHIFRGVVLKCIDGNKGYGYCVDCTQASVLCSDQKCGCYQPHVKLKCQNIKRISIFNKKLQSKIRDSSQIMDKLSAVNRQMIDKLSQFQQQIRKKIQFLGLNKADQLIAHKIINYSKNQQLMCSKDFIQYAKDYEQSQTKWFFEQTQHYLNLVSKVRQQIIQKFQKIQNLIYYELMCLAKNKSDVLFCNSSIVKLNSPQKNELIQMCKDLGHINKAIKIYEASKNKFTCQQFYKKCRNHSNLLFIAKDGQSNRIFGGFSSVKLSQKENYTYSDVQMKSFIFDLTNKIKSKLVKKQNTLTIFDSKTSNPQKNHDYIIVFGNASHPNLAFSENSITQKKNNLIDFESRNLLPPIFEVKTNPKTKQVQYGSKYIERDYGKQIKLDQFEVFQLVF